MLNQATFSATTPMLATLLLAIGLFGCGGGTPFIKVSGCGVIFGLPPCDPPSGETEPPTTPRTTSPADPEWMPPEISVVDPDSGLVDLLSGWFHQSHDPDEPTPDFDDGLPNRIVFVPERNSALIHDYEVVLEVYPDSGSGRTREAVGRARDLAYDAKRERVILAKPGGWIVWTYWDGAPAEVLAKIEGWVVTALGIGDNWWGDELVFALGYRMGEASKLALFSIRTDNGNINLVSEWKTDWNPIYDMAIDPDENIAYVMSGRRLYGVDLGTCERWVVSDETSGEASSSLYRAVTLDPSSNRALLLESEESCSDFRDGQGIWLVDLVSIDLTSGKRTLLLEEVAENAFDLTFDPASGHVLLVRSDP